MRKMTNQSTSDRRKEYIEEIRNAWLVEGPCPEYHLRKKRELREEWPSLYNAIEQSIESIWKE